MRIFSGIVLVCVIGLVVAAAPAELTPGTSIDTSATIEKLSELFNPPLDEDSQSVLYPGLSASASASTEDATADATGVFEAPDYEAKPYASATSSDGDRRVSSGSTMLTQSLWVHPGIAAPGTPRMMNLEFQYDGSLIFDDAAVDPGSGTAGAELLLFMTLMSPPPAGAPDALVTSGFYQDGGGFGVNPGETTTTFDDFGGEILLNQQVGFTSIPITSTVTDIVDTSGAIIGKNVNLTGSASFQSFVGAMYAVEFQVSAFTLGTGRFDLAEADFASTGTFELKSESGTTFNLVAIPEPTSAALFGIAGLALAALRRRG